MRLIDRSFLPEMLNGFLQVDVARLKIASDTRINSLSLVVMPAQGAYSTNEELVG